MNTKEIRQQESDRVRSIYNLCERHKIQNSHREYMLDNHLSIEDARSYVLKLLNASPQQEPIARPVDSLW